MEGSIKWNLWMGIFGFCLTFLFSLTANIWQTSAIRGAFGFFLFFLIAFLLRYGWGWVRKDRDSMPDASSSEQHP
ncbi:hypothetical protein EQV77_04020 [Halobacillus fulvus]|nr:hypothetical protein EQV77_04020 [Halobacillus fulvus]